MFHFIESEHFTDDNGITTQPFAVLKLYVDNEELAQKYRQPVDEHNQNMLCNGYPDSGFDLYVPREEQFVHQFSCKMIDFKVKAEMLYSSDGSKDPATWNSCGYYLYPRSSISKTPLMLANHTGIIDSGYRGNLKAAFDNVKGGMVSMEPFTRLLQICMPNLSPFQVEIVDELDDTSRGAGGFGSTGK